MTKNQLAELLASVEPSVYYGQQTERYWINQNLRRTKAELEDRLERIVEKVTASDRPVASFGWADWAITKLDAFEASSKPLARVYALDRDESEPCEALTPGCSIDHRLDAGDGCETW